MDLSRVTRITVVLDNGTVFEKYNAYENGAYFDIQDAGKTLKIFPLTVEEEGNFWMYPYNPNHKENAMTVSDATTSARLIRHDLRSARTALERTGETSPWASNLATHKDFRAVAKALDNFDDWGTISLAFRSFRDPALDTEKKLERIERARQVLESLES